MQTEPDIAEVKIAEDQTLSDLVNGQNGIVLVFLPDTTGISSRLQLKDLRNNFHRIQETGRDIAIITSETPEKSNDSSDDLSLVFPIIHDQDNQISRTFNTLGKNFENPYISKRTKRRTYILDARLDIIHLIDDIHPASHTEDIMRALDTDGQVQSHTTSYDHEEISSD